MNRRMLLLVLRCCPCVLHGGRSVEYGLESRGERARSSLLPTRLGQMLLWMLSPCCDLLLYAVMLVKRYKVDAAADEAAEYGGAPFQQPLPPNGL